MASQAKVAKLVEEARLSKLLFSDSSGLIDKFTEAADSDSSSESDVPKRKEKAKAAWLDEDDENINVGLAMDAQGRKIPDGGVNAYSGQYSNLVEHKFKQLVGDPEWAKLDRKVEEDSDDEILQSVGHLAKSSSVSLPSGHIELKNVLNLNKETGREARMITAIEFHPTSSVALLAGSSGIISLFAVDGKNNEKLHSVKFKHYPIRCVRFSKDGNEAYIGSNFPYFYMYDLINAKALRIPLPDGITKMTMFEVSSCGKYIAIVGRFGEVHLVCSRSKELIKTLKQSDEVTAILFSADGKKLFGHSSIGNVTVWDLSSLRVIHKWADDGCISGSSLAVSLCGKYLATGSAQGVVNLYNTNDVASSKTPKPLKVLMNLTTKITGLKFNPTSEILAFFSYEMPNAMRLLHIPSLTVFSNFPGFNADFGHCGIFNFSPHGGFCTFGGNNKIAYLFRLKHYKNY